MGRGTERMLALLRAIVELPIPVIAQVDGHIRAGGMGILGACDLVAAGPGASFAFTEARLALAPAVIALTVLPRMTPRAASHYMLTGRTFGAHDAVRIGLVTVAVADTAEALAPILADLTRSSRQGLRATKHVTTAWVRAAIQAHGEEAVRLSPQLFASEDAQIKMTSFLAKVNS